jgi:hypothetical protein
MSVTVLQPLNAMRIAPSAENCENRFICNEIEYHKFFSRFHDAVIHVYDAAGNVIETHEHKGEFKQVSSYLHHALQPLETSPAAVMHVPAGAVMQVDKLLRQR